jgi:hypothetical protein
MREGNIRQNRPGAQTGKPVETNGFLCLSEPKPAILPRPGRWHDRCFIPAQENPC